VPPLERLRLINLREKRWCKTRRHSSGCTSRTRRAKTPSFSRVAGCAGAQVFSELAETFEDEEHRRFGQAGFQVVDRVADIEKPRDLRPERIHPDVTRACPIW